MQKYKDQNKWRIIANFFPEKNRINKELFPIEKKLDWNNNEIHIDYYKKQNADIKIILLHGVGGNGRLLAFIGVPLFKLGYEIISPDLPGYGNSKVKTKHITYDNWVNLLNEIIDIEKNKDNKPIFLLGLSAGGMLAYHVAAINPKVKGIIVTNLLDQRDQSVRNYSAGNKFISRFRVFFLKLLSSFYGSLSIPIKYVVNMKLIVNNKKMLQILLNDPLSSGAKVSVRFLASLISFKPKLEPEKFKIPVLLAHPEKDHWTPVILSNIFFDKLKGPKEFKILKNAGHLPLESPGLQQLEKHISDFIEQYKNKNIT